ncbi:MAG: 4'-phosphopantetheinyl transferase superfamily protein [Negativicutes bacterium]|nr:4'-phosphopantetheinyl transferase superfamily protein [Negativicutes bacterium]
MQIYGTRLEGAIPALSWQDLCNLIPAYRYENIRALRFRQDQERSLLAGLLLRQIIIDNVGTEPVHFEFNPFGKPSLVGCSSFHFNLSHAGNWIVCAIDHQPIGVDVEKMEVVACASLARVAFSLEEQQLLQGKSGAVQLDYFYAVWTMKESYCKAVGQGLSMSPEKVTIRIDDQGWGSIAPPEKTRWRLRQYPVEPGYKLAVCASHEAFPEDVTLIDWRQLTGDQDSDPS